MRRNSPFHCGGTRLPYSNRKRTFDWLERWSQDHRYHLAALFVPFVALPVMSLLPRNPIFPAILAMAAGEAATVACRPDLKASTLVGGLLYAAYYAMFMPSLV